MSVRTTLSLLLLSLSLAACIDGDAPDGAEVDVTSTEQALDAPADPLLEYILGGSQTGSFRIGSTSDRLCFVSSLTGNFRGDGEHVWLSAPSYGWYLNKQAQQYGVQIGARCTPRWHFAPSSDSQLSVPAGWYSGGSGYRTANLWSYQRSICYLSGLQGAMNGLGNRAEMAISWPSWALDTFDIKANAMCLDLGSGRNSGHSGTYTWNPGTPDVRMMRVADGVCMISKVQGSMRSTSDWVGIYPADGYWYLTGTGNVSVDAACFRYAG